ncbi:hypothetical protein RI129_002494 [Pyrocoelia pectoralis]|uniref:non-specific serine/threonine protein kinase n=1 Tax=Pyrocoelia pectoralis TaxID=417401 RepID=A0AAN7ZM85_9COLE
MPRAKNGYKLPPPLPLGTVVEDINKNKWKLGPSIGKGGFGEIYSAKDASSTVSSFPYVVKIEPHANGPLFVEMHFYMRNGKEDLRSGRHEHNDEKYRFVVMDKFGSDIWKLFIENERRFSPDIVFKLGVQILDVLEFIHSKGYIHADIKAANILMGPGAESNVQVYLVDFGLCSHYSTNEKPDPKKAHNGTIEYVSRDGHLGIESRRGDLECLGYNLVQWLGCSLPWEINLTNPSIVQQSKVDNMKNLTEFFKNCFGDEKPPAAIIEYMKYVTTLKFETEPDYGKLRKILIKGLKAAGDSMKSPFNFKISHSSPSKRKMATESPSPKKKTKAVIKQEKVTKDNKSTKDDTQKETVPKSNTSTKDDPQKEKVPKGNKSTKDDTQKEKVPKGNKSTKDDTEKEKVTIDNKSIKDDTQKGKVTKDNKSTIDDDTQKEKVTKGNKSTKDDTQKEKVTIENKSIKDDTQKGKVTKDNKSAIDDDTQKGKVTKVKKSTKDDTQKEKVPKGNKSTKDDTQKEKVTKDNKSTIDDTQDKVPKSKKSTKDDTQKEKVTKDNKSNKDDAQKEKVPKGNKSTKDDSQNKKFTKGNKSTEDDTQKENVTKDNKSTKDDPKGEENKEIIVEKDQNIDGSEFTERTRKIKKKLDENKKKQLKSVAQSRPLRTRKEINYNEKSLAERHNATSRKQT